jgi:hypothetical protein
MAAQADAPDPISKKDRVEVDEQSNLLVEQSHVGEQLGGMDGFELVAGLDFHDQRSRDDEVCSIAAIKLDATMADRDAHLGLEGNPTMSKLMLEAGTVGGLEQSWAKDTVNLDGGPKDRRAPIRLAVHASCDARRRVRLQAGEPLALASSPRRLSRPGA